MKKLLLAVALLASVAPATAGSFGRSGGFSGGFRSTFRSSPSFRPSYKPSAPSYRPSYRAPSPTIHVTPRSSVSDWIVPFLLFQSMNHQPAAAAPQVAPQQALPGTSIENPQPSGWSTAELVIAGLCVFTILIPLYFILR